VSHATKSKVLFLCTGNSCRSQMAEGWLRKLGGDRFEAFSAGTKPSEVNALAIEAMAEVGIDISQHRSKLAAEFFGQHMSYIITVCDNAKESCPIFPGTSERMHWPFEDPASFTGTEEQKLQGFRRVRDEIRDAVSQFVARTQATAGR
jgi:arsenate reductase (thioredoxin)